MSEAQFDFQEYTIDDVDGPLWRWIKDYGNYYRRFTWLSESSTLQGQGYVAVLPIAEFDTFTAYRKRLSKHSGNFNRDAERALKRGYQLYPIQPEEHVEDIVAIRRSKWFRAFGPVVDAILLSPKVLAKEFSRTKVMRLGNRDAHWERWWGIFTPAPAATAGMKGPLVGFACVHRIGRVARYAQFMGHGLYLRHGIMMALHNGIVKALLDAQEPALSGVHYLTYGAIEQGSEGLAFWKRKALFEPRVIVFPTC